MKKFIFNYLVYICIGIILTSAFCYANKNNEIGNMDKLVSAFNVSGAEFTSGEIYILADSNFKEVHKIVHKIPDKLGFQNPLIKIQETGLFRQFIIEGNNNKINLDIKIQRTSESRIPISITIKADSKVLENSIDKILNIFNNKLHAKFNVCFYGTIEKKLSKREFEHTKKKILKITGSKIIEEIKEENLISVSAHSPYFTDYIKVKNKKVNLNFALRRNKEQDKTFIWIATPLIIIEY